MKKIKKFDVKANLEMGGKTQNQESPTSIQGAGMHDTSPYVD